MGRVFISDMRSRRSFGKSYYFCQKQQPPPKDPPDLISEINTPPMLYYSNNGGHKNRLNKLSQNKLLTYL